MVKSRRKINFRWIYKRSFWSVAFFLAFLGFLRWSKGAGFVDAYSLLIKPFWPGSAQSEWIVSGDQLEKNIRLKLLEEDNQRLRKILALKRISSADRISAAVIARSIGGWWQQLELNKGIRDDIKKGDAVIGPGGLVGIIHSVSFNTSRVKLLTAPGSQIGVWIQRNKNHGLLIGMGTNRTKLNLLDNETDIQPGDVVATSPASTLLPPNLLIGIVQSVSEEALPTQYAIVQLSASPESIDWVQILKSR